MPLRGAEKCYQCRFSVEMHSFGQPVEGSGIQHAFINLHSGTRSASLGSRLSLLLAVWNRWQCRQTYVPDLCPISLCVRVCVCVFRCDLIRLGQHTTNSKDH